MSPPRLKHISSLSKLSIISLSSFDTRSSFHDNQFISYHHHNTNNYKSYLTEKQPVNTKSFTQTLDQAVEYFEQILNQCATPSNASLLQNNDHQERKNVLNSKLELKKRDREDGLHSIDKKENFILKQRKPKINCRKWCEEQNRQMARHNNLMDDMDRISPSRNNRRTFGSTFFCRKALLQKPDGTTYICIRKRLN